MPSVFEKAFAENLPALYGAMGLAATYTEASGATPVTGLLARVHRGETRQVEKDGETMEAQTADIYVQTTGANGTAKILRDGRITVEGNEVWTVVTTPTTKNGEHCCTCTRMGRVRLKGRRGDSNG